MKPTSPILEARNIARRFGGVVAVKDANLTVGEGEIVGLIGPNGSGKSTMVNLITGELAPNSGSIRFGGRDITALPSFQRARMGMARSFQMLRLFHSLSVEDNLLLAHHIRMQSGTVASIFGRRAARDEEAAVRKRACCTASSAPEGGAPEVERSTLCEYVAAPPAIDSSSRAPS